MKDFITKEMLEAATVDLPEKYTTAVVFSCCPMSGFTRAHVAVLKHVGGKSVLVYNGTHTQEVRDYES